MDLLFCASKPRRRRDRTQMMPVAIGRWSNELKTSEVVTADDDIPEVNMDLTGMETFSVLISRGRQGFGFTVFGSSPVQVGRVDEGSPAFNAGLRRNDCIVRINCQNVSRSMAESVARIVRETENALRLEIQRSPVADETPTSPMWPQYLDDSSRVPPATESPSARLSITPKQQQQQQHHHHYSSITQPRLPPRRRPLTTIVNNNRVRPQTPTASENADQKSSCSFENSDRKSCCSEPIQRPCPRRVTGTPRSRKAPMPLPVDAEERSANEEQPSTDIEGDERPSINENKSVVSLENDTTYSPATDDKKISSYEQIQWPAIQKLISCEEDFVLQMQKGCQRYLYPLKEEFLSPDQHWTVFQNLEELIAFSQCHVQELHRYLESTTPGDQSGQQEPSGDCEGREILPLEGRISIGALVSVYLIKIDSFCSAYESYCPGIVDALHSLASLKRANPLLQSYLKRTSAQDSDRFSISAFLQKPIEHIKEQVLALQKILRYMQTTTSDYLSLKRIVQCMRSCCSAINTSHIQRCNSSTSSLSSIDQQAPVKSPSLSSSSSSSPSSSSSSHSVSASVAASVASSVVSSIDSEVLRIQSRLIFPDNVRTFHLATASHHMIYSGRLTLVEAGSTTSLFVALLSDLLVLTRPDPVGEALYVLQEPILLHDVVGCNFSCAHICEFVISIETPLKSLQSSWAPRSLVMRAPSVEMKCTWKNILEQRISASKTQRDVTITSRLCSRIV